MGWPLAKDDSLGGSKIMYTFPKEKYQPWGSLPFPSPIPQYGWNKKRKTEMKKFACKRNCA